MRRRFFYNKSEKDAYLTIEALEDGLSVSFDSMSNSIEYSIDESQNWKILQYDATTDSILKGQKIKFRGYCVPLHHDGIGRFHITHKCKLYGNCMSLLYYDKASLFNRVLEFSFYKLFFDCPIISVSNDFLPATILTESCYKLMFGYCSSMIEAPTLPATTLAEYCYSEMFYRCSNLNYIKMLATDISAVDCLAYWVEGVASTGTFVKNKDATWNTTPGAFGVSGVPAGWTVITEDEESGGSEITFYIMVDLRGHYNSYQAKEGMTWEEWVNSSYNTDGYSLENAEVKDTIVSPFMLGCTIVAADGSVIAGTDVIIAGYKYGL